MLQFRLQLIALSTDDGGIVSVCHSRICSDCRARRRRLAGRCVAGRDHPAGTSLLCNPGRRYSLYPSRLPPLHQQLQSSLCKSCRGRSTPGLRCAPCCCVTGAIASCRLRVAPINNQLLLLAEKNKLPCTENAALHACTAYQQSPESRGSLWSRPSGIRAPYLARAYNSEVVICTEAGIGLGQAFPLRGDRSWNQESTLIGNVKPSCSHEASCSTTHEA